MRQEDVVEMLRVAQLTTQQVKRILDAFYDPEWGYDLPSKVVYYLFRLLRGEEFSDSGAKEKIKKRLSGEGHIGVFCPKCYQPLEFRDREVLSNIYEYWVCRECLTQYSVRYSAVDWREERGAEDLELEERVKKLKLTESDKFIKQLKRLWDYAP